MSGIAEKVRYAQDKDGMLRRALERIIQLYTDKSHFVYELLQNAEDAEATSIRFVQYPDRLEVMHNGKPFTAENLQGLCDIGKSDKVDNLNQIGEFGVGFKSVFGICDTVKLYSEPSHFRTHDIGSAVPFAVEILDFTTPKDIPSVSMDSFYTTRFIFPYTVGRTFSGFKSLRELNDTLSKKLQNLGITTLLFMKNLETIEYEIRLDTKEISGSYILEKEVINNHCSLVSALGQSNISSTQKGIEEISYLMFSRSVDSSSKRTVDIAFPVKVKDGEYECQKPGTPYISVYFPTETESKLGFIVQGPYRTTPNRSSIPADDADNVSLAKETAMLLHDSLLELKNSGKLNMSFVKVLPLSPHVFENFGLFYPLYTAVKGLFSRESIIPCKNGGYVSAKFAKIMRQEKLFNLLPDELLSQLINDGNTYHWLPSYLTETNKEYEHVYKYLNGELGINVIRPEDLRNYFSSNPTFLPKMSNDWLVELYSILENVGAAFAKTRNEANMLTAEIIKTTTGKFVAAYRRTENRSYIPNVFLPTEKMRDLDINFVDSEIYNRCRHFFDNILQLQKPNEYELFIKDIRKRYSEGYLLDKEKHIEDIIQLYKYSKYDGYYEEITKILQEIFVVKCTDGKMHNAYMSSVFLPVTDSGMDLQGYLKNIAKNVFFVDWEYYSEYNVSSDMLWSVGVQDSILVDDDYVTGEYFAGNKGRQPTWWTTGDFRWKITLEYIKEVVCYISKYPTAKDSIIKSKTIFAWLLDNETKLCGEVKIGGSTPNLIDEPCELIKELRGDKRIRWGWDGKWLFTESAELVSPKEVSKHDISTSIYGKLKPNSVVYDLLGFQKTTSDEVDEFKKGISQKQLDTLFEEELKQRFGVTSDDLSAHFSSGKIVVQTQPEYEYELVFPASKVKNWDTLKKHAAEMLCYADPVKYDFAVRRVRISNKPKEIRAYLSNMYRYDGTYKYACQMCHDSCSSIECAQIFNNPDVELDPMNLLLCPNCASMYRKIRSDNGEMDYFKTQILSLTDSKILNSDPVVLDIDGEELWFTQTHIAEIRALLKLKEDINSGKEISVNNEDDNPDEKNGLSAYLGFIGKTIRQKNGFVGTIIDVSKEYATIKITEGRKVGEETKIHLSFVVGNSNLYTIE